MLVLDQEYLSLLAVFHETVQRLQARTALTLPALEALQTRYAVVFVTKYEALAGKITCPEHCPASTFASLVSVAFAKLHAFLHETSKTAAVGPPWFSSLGPCGWAVFACVGCGPCFFLLRLAVPKSLPLTLRLFCSPFLSPLVQDRGRQR